MKKRQKQMWHRQGQRQEKLDANKRECGSPIMAQRERGAPLETKPWQRSWERLAKGQEWHAKKAARRQTWRQTAKRERQRQRERATLDDKVEQAWQRLLNGCNIEDIEWLWHIHDAYNLVYMFDADGKSARHPTPKEVPWPIIYCL